MRLPRLPRKKSAVDIDIADSFGYTGGSDSNVNAVAYNAAYSAYRCCAWVNIAIGILTRNVARAAFTLRRDGNEITTGPLFELFRRPGNGLSRYDLWKETAAWWLLEGEAFWWFGPDYAGGIPREIIVLDPRKVRHEEGVYDSDGVGDFHRRQNRRWFYQSDIGRMVPLLRDEVVHFRDWNPWNPVRGVNPLLALSMELDQDMSANRANSRLLKNNAIPEGILKTDQPIRPEEADALEKRWEGKYGALRESRRIAVLGKGTTFQPVTFSPDVVRLFELKRWNLYTILAKYGIPPRVAGVQDKGSTLSGKDTTEQHAALWKFTIIPLLRQFEQILEAQFFAPLGLREEGIFDLADIPELQRSEDEQSNRDIAEINAGLKTINDVLRERGRDPKPWGDVWYRPKDLIPMDGA